MATVTITISLKPGTTQLHLEDSQGHSGDAPSFWTDVNRGDTVIWEIKPNSVIEELTGIRAKDGRFNLFNPDDPHKNGNGRWKGKVKDDAAGEDAYDIDYVVNGNLLSEDPTIRVPPTP